MEEYERTMDAYDTAMHLSDFNAVCKYVDPSEMAQEDCLKRFDNLKIVSYDLLTLNVAGNKQEVSQKIEVEYYFLDRYVVRKIRYEQSWQYRQDSKTWILQTAPPIFK